jgi:hypothetical protein
MDDYISKPIDHAILFEAIERVRLTPSGVVTVTG